MGLQDDCHLAGMCGVPWVKTMPAFGVVSVMMAAKIQQVFLHHDTHACTPETEHEYADPPVLCKKYERLSPAF